MRCTRSPNRSENKSRTNNKMKRILLTSQFRHTNHNKLNIWTKSHEERSESKFGINFRSATDFSRSLK